MDQFAILHSQLSKIADEIANERKTRREEEERSRNSHEAIVVRLTRIEEQLKNGTETIDDHEVKLETAGHYNRKLEERVRDVETTIWWIKALSFGLITAVGYLSGIVEVVGKIHTYLR